MSNDDEPVGSPRDPRLDRDDYRPDVGGRVEAPPDAPAEMVNAALRLACPSCLPNVFIERTHRGDWSMKIAHDDTCPALLEWELRHGAIDSKESHD